MEVIIHPDLRKKYATYRVVGLLFLIIAVTSPVMLFLVICYPPVAAILAGVPSNLVLVLFGILELMQTVVMVFFSYWLGFRRMKFLERASALVSRGVATELTLTAIGRRVDNVEGPVYSAYLMPSNDRTPERYNLMVTDPARDFLTTLPEVSRALTNANREKDMKMLPLQNKNQRVRAYLDNDTKRVLALEYQGRLLWTMPPG